LFVSQVQILTVSLLCNGLLMFGISSYSSEDGSIQLSKRSCWLLSTLSMAKCVNKSDIILAKPQSAIYVLQIYPW